MLAVLSLAASAALTPGAVADAQFTTSGPAPIDLGLETLVTCAPSLPGGPVCPTLRLEFTAPEALEMIQYSILMPRAVFAASGPGVGTFTGQDAAGPVSGVTSVTSGGQYLFVNFLANLGRPFVVGTGPSGYFLDVPAVAGALGPGDLTPRPGGEGPLVRFKPLAVCMDVPGQCVCLPEVPEPRVVVLLGTGLAVLAGAAARRRRAGPAERSGVS